MTFTIQNLRIQTVSRSVSRVCYILYPIDYLLQWAQTAAKKYNVTIVAISGMDWDDDLTPWPAEGQPPGSEPFLGLASRFLDRLVNDVMPEVERRLGLTATVERTLAGVSLSGLFTLWQWMGNDTFRNIISLSGSFWYEGFEAWVKSHPVPHKAGRAYFLLGVLEAKTDVKAFQSVQTDTEEIVDYLRAHGIDCTFDLVPGNHYQHGEQRLTRAMTWMYGEE